MRQLIKILLSLTLFLLRFFLVIKNWLVSGLGLLSGPGRAVLRGFYYILIFPVYRLYLLASKKLGLSKSKKGRVVAAVLINKRIVHVLIVVLAVFLVYVNFVTANQTVPANDVVGKTLLAKIVTDELVQSEDLIEEFQGDKNLFNEPARDYWSNNAYWRPPLAYSYQEEEWQPGGNIAVRPRPGQAPERSEIIEYTVQAGDTISSIAQYFGISVNTVLWENGLTVKSYIKPGNILRILPTTGVTYKVARGDNLAAIASKHGATPDDIMKMNNLASANQVRIGQTLIIPGGKRVIDRGIATPSQQPRSLASIITSPRGSAVPVSGSKMNWPAQGRITQYYSWRHSGLDIANKTGTPVYAAAGGTVVEAGWNSGGYGYQIVIDHGGGRKTRYAHLSKFAVSAGDEVGKGDNIGFVGSTGRSTGSHLHFEVMINGKRYNPLSYLGY
jgi:murein DD-endopeptidase MepM/ murein hydrolase activator NlpD